MDNRIGSNAKRETCSDGAFAGRFDCRDIFVARQAERIFGSVNGTNGTSLNFPHWYSFISRRGWHASGAGIRPFGLIAPDVPRAPAVLGRANRFGLLVRYPGAASLTLLAPGKFIVPPYRACADCGTMAFMKNSKLGAVREQLSKLRRSSLFAGIRCICVGCRCFRQSDRPWG